MSQDILLSLIDTDSAQPRKHFNDSKITELAESMSANGLIVPVMVRPVGNRFVIVHGERRYRAAKSLGWATIPAEVRALDTEAARWFALVENIQRADLSPIEEAKAYKAMLDTGITQTELGKRIGKGQSYIAQKLRLLSLPAPLQCYLDLSLITEGHAKQLLRLRGIYTDDVKRRFDPVGIGDMRFDPDITLASLSAALRPYAKVIMFKPDNNMDAHMSAARAFRDHVLSNDCQPPSWSVAAYWWAMLSTVYNFSVADLKAAIDGWIELIYSAIAGLGSDTDRRMYSGDIRHAGFDATSLPQSVWEAARQWVLQAGYYVAPSQVDNRALWTAAGTNGDGAK